MLKKEEEMKSSERDGDNATRRKEVQHLEGQSNAAKMKRMSNEPPFSPIATNKRLNKRSRDSAERSVRYEKKRRDVAKGEHGGKYS